MATAKHQVGFLVDGSFLPVRNGTNYSIVTLMKALYQSGQVEPNLLISYRGWDDPRLYQDQDFRTIFLSSQDRYEGTGVMEYAFNVHNIRHLHIYNAEEVLELSPRLKHLGVNIVYEAINIDHILYGKLTDDKKLLSQTKERQRRALEMADSVLCRSEVDKQHILAMGIPAKKISVYRGAISVKDIAYKPRAEQRYKVVFLGHMYYPPNENALKFIADKILPALKKLDSRYSVTVIGIIAPAIKEHYARAGIIFRDGVDDLSEELLKYDVAIAPLFEGSGTRLKILDFLASGLPVVSTTLGVEGLHEDIARCLVIEDDINSYAAQINNIVRDLAKYEKIALRGRAYVERHYDWSRSLHPFLTIYEKYDYPTQTTPRRRVQKNVLPHL